MPILTTVSFPSGRPLRLAQSLRLAIVCVVLAGLVAGCGNTGGFAGNGTGVKRSAFTSAEYGVGVSERVTRHKNPPKGGGRYQVGKPYTVAGKTYTPREDPDYRASGRASWYGDDFHGRRTANGEIFSANAITAAHPTLPLPSYVRVTNADNGRSLIVRVNDRGPYVHGRIIDLSARAASMLGYMDRGVGNVEVTYIGRAPLEGDDTRFLLASYNAVTPFEQTRFAANDKPLPEFELRSLLSFADASPARGVGALDAAAGLAEGRLPALGGPSLDIEIGRFARDEAASIATAFARIAAVEEVGEGEQTRVIVKTLKPGVGRADLSALASELGLRDPIR